MSFISLVIFDFWEYADIFQVFYHNHQHRFVAQIVLLNFIILLVIIAATESEASHIHRKYLTSALQNKHISRNHDVHFSTVHNVNKTFKVCGTVDNLTGHGCSSERLFV